MNAHAHVAQQEQPQSPGKQRHGKGKCLTGIHQEIGEIHRRQQVQRRQQAQGPQPCPGRTHQEQPQPPQGPAAPAEDTDQIQPLDPAEQGHPRAVPTVQQQKKGVGPQGQGHGGGHQAATAPPGEQHGKHQTHGDGGVFHRVAAAAGKVQGHERRVQGRLQPQKGLRHRSHSCGSLAETHRAPALSAAVTSALSASRPPAIRGTVSSRDSRAMTL